MEYLKFSVTATISHIIHEVAKINDGYIVLNHSSYRYIFGQNAIINPDMIESNNSNPRNEISEDLKKKLEEEIRGGKLDKIEKVINRIIDEMKSLEYNDIMVSGILVFNIIKNTIDASNKMSLKPLAIELASLGKSVLIEVSIDVVIENVTYFYNLFKKKFGVTPKEYAVSSGRYPI